MNKSEPISTFFGVTSTLPNKCHPPSSQTDLFKPCRLETLPEKRDLPVATLVNVVTAQTLAVAADVNVMKTVPDDATVDARKKVRSNRGLLQDSNKAEVNKYGTKETVDNDSDRWLNFKVPDVDSDKEKLISNCVAAQVRQGGGAIFVVELSLWCMLRTVFTEYCHAAISVSLGDLVWLFLFLRHPCLVLVPEIPCWSL
jgi:hypothetical protein